MFASSAANDSRSRKKGHANEQILQERARFRRMLAQEFQILRNGLE